MAKRTDGQRLAELDRRKAAVEAQRQALKARMARKARAIDTRRKILAGSFLLYRLEIPGSEADALRDLLRRELAGFLRESDRGLFADLLEHSGPAAEDGPADRNPEGGAAGDPPPPDSEVSIEEVLRLLNAEEIRCTYGAAGEALGIRPVEVARRLGARRPETSWIVRRDTGLPSPHPTEWEASELHGRLERTPEIVRSGEALRRRCLARRRKAAAGRTGRVEELQRPPAGP